MEVVKIKNPDFSYWAWSTPWGQVLSLKSFCQNPVLSWAIRYSVFQFVKFTSSFEFVCRTIFSIFWHLVVKFGYKKWFLSNKKSGVFPFGWNKHIIILSFFKKNFLLFFFVDYYISKYIKNKTGKKNFFLKKLKIMICLFHRNGKTPLFLMLKNHLLYPNLTTRCQKVEKIVRQTNSNSY